MLNKYLFNMHKPACTTFVTQTGFILYAGKQVRCRFAAFALRYLFHYFIFHHSAANNGVDKYRSPESGRITTIFLPAFSSRWAI